MAIPLYHVESALPLHELAIRLQPRLSHPLIPPIDHHFIFSRTARGSRLGTPVGDEIDLVRLHRVDEELVHRPRAVEVVMKRVEEVEGVDAVVG